MTAWMIAALGLGLPVYSYCGYPALLFLLASAVQAWRDLTYLWRRTDRRCRWEGLPSVSVIIAAHNEEAVIEAKLRNTLVLRYPRERLEIIVGSDGSDDATEDIVRRFADQGVRLLAFHERRGKLSVLNDCVREAKGEILLFSDANTMLEPDALTRLVRHFADPGVGVVCGELRLQGERRETAYWHFEVTLKFLESRLDSALGANGAIYAMRRALYPFPPKHLITDDFVIPMMARMRGYRIRYDPEALAHEEVTGNAGHEFRRRVRIGAGNFQALWCCRSLLLPWKGFVSLCFWSHKVLRWFTPFLLVTGLVASLCMIRTLPGRVLVAAQAGFYLLALLGHLLTRVGLHLTLLRLPGYFLLINAGLACGLFELLLGRQKAAWERTARSAAEGMA